MGERKQNVVQEIARRAPSQPAVFLGSIQKPCLIGKMVVPFRWRAPSCLTPPRSPLKGIYPINSNYIRCKLGLIIKGTIPRVPPFSQWISRVSCLLNRILSRVGGDSPNLPCSVPQSSQPESLMVLQWRGARNVGARTGGEWSYAQGGSIWLLNIELYLPAKYILHNNILHNIVCIYILYPGSQSPLKKYFPRIVDHKSLLK